MYNQHIRWLILLIPALLLFACDSLNDGSNSSSDVEEMNPLNDHLNESIHQLHVAFLEEHRGISTQTAVEESFVRQLQYVPLIYEAVKRGIEISNEEAFERANLEREYGLSNQRQRHMEWITSHLNMSEDDYWNYFVISDYREQLMIEQLDDVIYQEYGDEDTEYFAVFHEYAIETFLEEQHEHVQSFKEQIGLE